MHFTKRYPYRFGDIDHAGIAYYPSLLHYVHCAFEDWWAEALGTRYPDLMRDERLGFPAVRLDTEFFSPIRYGDEPTIHLGVLHVGTTSLQIGAWMTLGDEQRPACRAVITTVATDMDTIEKRPITDAWRARFDRFRIDAADLPGRS